VALVSAIDFEIGTSFDAYVIIIRHIKFIQTRNEVSFVMGSNSSGVLELRLIPRPAFLFTVSLIYGTTKMDSNTTVFQLVEEAIVEVGILTGRFVRGSEGLWVIEN
jgi:hypothetical protein